MRHLLIVDDETHILTALRERFERDGFEVVAVGNGQDALGVLLGEGQPIDCVVLDLMLPDMDGFEVLRRLRQAGADVPVVVLTARADDVDKIVGLELGADDYVSKPFNPRELVARVRVLLRRMDEVQSLRAKLAQQTSASAVTSSGLQLDQAQHSAIYHGVKLDLRPKEFELLATLAAQPGQALSREFLLDKVWGFDSFIDPRTIDVHIRRLREKLTAIDPTADLIETERGSGYRLRLPVAGGRLPVDGSE